MPPTQSLSRRSERSVRTSGVLADTTATVDGTALAAGLDPGGYLRKVRGKSLALQGGDESDKCYLTESYAIPGIVPSCKPIA